MLDTLCCVSLSQLLLSRDPPKQVLGLHDLIPDAVDSPSDFSGDYDEYSFHSPPIDDEDEYGSGSGSGLSPDDGEVDENFPPVVRTSECTIIN